MSDAEAEGTGGGGQGETRSSGELARNRQGKKKPAKPTREERLAEALRANLRRRKAAAKERAS